MLTHFKSPKSDGSDDVGSNRADQNPNRNPHHHPKRAPNVPIASIVRNKETRHVAQPYAEDHRDDFSGP